MSCERCGADIVEGEGACRACGWQVPELDDETFGRTRAATDIPPANDVQHAGPSRASASSAANLYDSAYPGRTAGVSRTAGAPLMAQYCGACGARLEGQEAFCGQCGAPVVAAPHSRPIVPPAARSQAPSAANPAPTITPLGWQTEDHAAYTEAIPEFGGQQAGFSASLGGPVTGMPAGPLGGPIGPGGFPYPQGSQVPPVASRRGVRSGRIALGVVCLLGSLGTAAAAIILAFAPGS